MYYFNCLCHDLYFKASCVVKHHFFLKNDLKIPHLLYIRDINQPLNPAMQFSISYSTCTIHTTNFLKILFAIFLCLSPWTPAAHPGSSLPATSTRLSPRMAFHKTCYYLTLSNASASLQNASNNLSWSHTVPVWASVQLVTYILIKCRLQIALLS